MSIVGHGIDIVEIARIEQMLREHGERFVERCFTAAEREYCEAGGSRRGERYAVRFAAKEATFKALGTGWRSGIAWTDASVVHEPSGQPRLEVGGKCREIARELGISGWQISLSHAGAFAIASVIALGPARPAQAGRAERPSIHPAPTPAPGRANRDNMIASTMAKKSGQPALYEMMRNRGSMSPVQVAPPPERHVPVREIEPEIEVMRDDASPSPVLEKILALASPGRTLRVPVGYLLLACAPVIVVLVVAYAVGVQSGKSIQRAEFDEKFGTMPSNVPGVNDPLTTLQPIDQPPPSNPPANNNRGTPERPPQASPNRTASTWGPVVPASEPRQKGWNYFIAAENTTARCKQLAEFCRANGLETYVVPYKNGGRVIVFPGYQGPRDAPEVKALEERMHQIGDKYKAANKYETNMRDAYPAKYDGEVALSDNRPQPKKAKRAP